VELPEHLCAPEVARLDAGTRSLLRRGGAVLDGRALKEMDSVGEAWLCALQRLAGERSVPLQLAGFSVELQAALTGVRSAGPPMPSDADASTGFFEKVGESGYALFRELRHMTYLFSESVYWSTIGRFDKGRLPFGGIVIQQLVRLGSSATSIVFLLTFLVGLTLAFQSAIQLELLGASVYLVRGVVFSMFMEIGPLITAIILAGRSGSAITAEIASMVVQEEVKALRTMGIHPVQYLVLPRFQAMSIAVPLLTMLANASGCFAGYAVGALYCDLPTSLFFTEFREALPVVLVAKSLFKGLVFGWIITLVSTAKGISVRGGADAVGRATTQCVVFSISAIILADAVFSFLFY
jgi:phospholipid/cholesterol/gamma-HCH transport system permease protein